MARARELGAELRELREAQNLGVRELARRAELTTHARISQWENGQRLPDAEDLHKVLDQLGVNDDDRDRLIGMVREASGLGEAYSGMPGTGRVLTDLIEYERRATMITDVAPLVIPGLLQTSDYARAIIGQGPNVETRVALRSGRRDVLTRGNPVHLVTYIDSEVLVRPIAPQHVMVEQLRHLLSMAQRPNVTLQLVSSTRQGWHPMLAGPFELIEFPKAGPIVLLEHHRSSLFLWKKEDVQEFVAASAEIQKAAMTPAESAEAIAFIVNGTET